MKIPQKCPKCGCVRIGMAVERRTHYHYKNGKLYRKYDVEGEISLRCLHCNWRKDTGINAVSEHFKLPI